MNSSHKYIDAKNHFGAYGIKVGDLSYDFSAIMKQKDTTVAALTKGIEGLFKKNKVRGCMCSWAAVEQGERGEWPWAGVVTGAEPTKELELWYATATVKPSGYIGNQLQWDTQVLWECGQF